MRTLAIFLAVFIGSTNYAKGQDRNPGANSNMWSGYSYPKPGSKNNPIPYSEYLKNKNASEASSAAKEKSQAEYNQKFDSLTLILRQLFSEIEPHPSAGIIIYKQDLKWGIFGYCDPVFDRIIYDSTPGYNVILAKKDKKWGMFSPRMQISYLEMNYDTILKQKIINAPTSYSWDWKGERIVPPRGFYDHFIKTNGKWGVYNINEKKHLLKCVYDSLKFSTAEKAIGLSGFYIAKLNDKWGVIKTFSEEIVIPFDYDNINLYSGNTTYLFLRLFKNDEFADCKVFANGRIWTPLNELKFSQIK